MGFLRRNIELEQYFDRTGIEWSLISDQKYLSLFRQMSLWLDSQEYSVCTNQQSIQDFLKQHQHAYVLSVPRHPILSIFVEGGSLSTIGYEIHHLEKTTEDLNVFDCILTDASGSWVCTFNHEWQSGQHPQQLFCKF